MSLFECWTSETRFRWSKRWSKRAVWCVSGWGWDPPPGRHRHQEKLLGAKIEKVRFFALKRAAVPVIPPEQWSCLGLCARMLPWWRPATLCTCTADGSEWGPDPKAANQETAMAGPGCGPVWVRAREDSHADPDLSFEVLAWGSDESNRQWDDTHGRIPRKPSAEIPEAERRGGRWAGWQRGRKSGAIGAHHQPGRRPASLRPRCVVLGDHRT